MAALAALALGLMAAATLLGLRARSIAGGFLSSPAAGAWSNLGIPADVLPADRLGVDAAVELVVVGVGAVAATWVGLSALLALACGLAARAGRRWATGERLVARSAPAVVRRLAHAAVGAGIGLALAAPTAVALPASATDTDSAPVPHVLDLGWRPTTPTPTPAPVEEPVPPVAGPAADPAAGPAAPVRAELTDRSLPGGAGRPPAVVVVPGDSLWKIAATHLGGSPTDSEIAESVARWYAGNRAVVGPDPDLILPGMTLRAPSA